MRRKPPMLLIVCTILIAAVWIYYYMANGQIIFFAGEGQSLSSCIGLAVIIGAWIRYLTSNHKK